MSGRTPDHSVPVPVNFQDWECVTFLHWPYQAEAVQRLVPNGLSVQQQDGMSWIGITPFRMARVRVPGLPPPPAWRAFPELNVRAYVRARDGRDGIWFLGMVAPRLVFLTGLRSLGLPYARTSATLAEEGPRWSYRFGTPSWRRPPADSWFHAVVEVGEALEEAERTPLVDSITGRWSAYHRRRRAVAHTGRARDLAAARGDGHRNPYRAAALGGPAHPERRGAGACRSGGAHSARQPSSHLSQWWSFS